MWFLIALACIILLAILLLSIPLSFAFRLDIYGKPKFSLVFIWLFGLIKRPIIDKGRKKPATKKKARPKKKGRGLKIWSMLCSPGLPRQFWRFIKNVLGCIHIRDFELDFRLGLDSPADTGFMFAVFQSISMFLPAHCSVTIRPEFSESIIEGYSRGTVTLRPICVVASVFGFFFSMASLRLIRGFVTGKWKK